jgi:hypothetical protein
MADQELSSIVKKRLESAEALTRSQLEIARALALTIHKTGGPPPDVVATIAQVLATNFNTIVMNAKVVK